MSLIPRAWIRAYFCHDRAVELIGIELTAAILMKIGLGIYRIIFATCYHRTRVRLCKNKIIGWLILLSLKFTIHFLQFIQSKYCGFQQFFAWRFVKIMLPNRR
ncbi:MAG: hypothetical protein DYG96_14510 [Chlorobi bacterium CHB2]|nr:hypothetical protein [Chlorobi bacterium CHB2]